MSISGVALGVGEGSGTAMVLDEPLSFWGGVDPETGEIIDRQHPQSGSIIAGVVIIVRHARGSSGTPSVLTEAVRRGTGPAAIVLQEADPMFVVGSVVINELYPDRSCQVVVVGEQFDELRDGVATSVSSDGTVTQQA